MINLLWLALLIPLGGLVFCFWAIQQMIRTSGTRAINFIFIMLLLATIQVYCLISATISIGEAIEYYG